MNDHHHQALSMMNTAVALVLLIPLLLVLTVTEREIANLNQKLKASNTSKPAQLPQKRPDQPPVITISEVEVYSFASGQFELTPGFMRYIADKLIPQLGGLAATYSCDVIDVIGHTDEQPVQTASNLDKSLLSTGNDRSIHLQPGSNLDLGFLRASAVIRAIQADGRLGAMHFYAYSAGQTILPGGEIASPEKRPPSDATRRRIEIRLRRSK
jgi:flagellar motor protein MotB